ncbi:TIGR03089 family protein [Arthrobacter sp. NEB 688]|uniref:TIGR03089 family protein n=1 Tax=Arthrobacter sp. NEB 688 TaxID=904039 RepID=UPI001566ABC8|nr:TIGR03089 family protein [Arthrobacter sp. NEB 688]QKE85528.1 TIGR03089 family protein [Arthrobacter sp. NEB 688]
MAHDPTPAALLARLVASDPGRPRITVYDDTDGPTRGERIELSARVLANWVAKAANLLQDELDAAPGTTVRLALPPHWRTLYWALAAWSVGACVLLPDAPGPADVVVTDEPAGVADLDDAEHVVVVTLAALARTAAVDVPSGAVDEAREIATHGDVFEPWEEPEPGAPGLRTATGETPLGDLVPADAATVQRAHTGTDDTGRFLALALELLAGDGSVVLTRGTPADDVLASRLAAEGVTGRR